MVYLAIANEPGVMRDSLTEIVMALKKEKPRGVARMFSDRPDLERATIYRRKALEALVWAFPRKSDEKSSSIYFPPARSTRSASLVDRSDSLPTLTPAPMSSSVTNFS